jgi:hypothetical protein
MFFSSCGVAYALRVSHEEKNVQKYTFAVLVRDFGTKNVYGSMITLSCVGCANRIIPFVCAIKTIVLRTSCVDTLNVKSIRRDYCVLVFFVSFLPVISGTRASRTTLRRCATRRIVGCIQYLAGQKSHF